MGLFYRFFSYELEPFSFLFYTISIFIFPKSKGIIGKDLLVFQNFFSFVLMIMAEFGRNIFFYDLKLIVGAFFSFKYFYSLFNSKIKHTFVVCISFFVIVNSLNKIFFSQILIFDSIGYSISSLGFVVFAFMYFHQLFMNVNTKNLLEDFNFWHISSLLIYHFGTFFIFLLFAIVTKQIIRDGNKDSEIQLAMGLWSLHNIFLFIGSIVMLTGTLWVRYKKKSI